MIAAQRWNAGAVTAPAGPAAWLRARAWLGVPIVLALWALVPEMRRLIDWKIGFNSVSLVSVVPLLALVPPAAALVYGGKLRALRPALAWCGWLWLGGFSFALAVGLMAGNGAAALYTYAEFVLPMAFGLWVATLDLPWRLLHARVARFLLALSTPLCLYAAYQFVKPPVWDVLWMLHANITAIGVPLPYQFRPFSTLNSPGPFADLLVAAIVLNLPRLDGAKPLRLAQVALCLATLMLTMVRSDWIALVVAVLCYVVLTPNRARNLALLSVACAACAVLAFNASALLGDAAAGNGLQARLQTFTDLSSDRSYNERQSYFGDVLTTAFEQPTGTGLGITGTAAKLGSLQRTLDFDNGYVARFTEMGYFGTACYLAVMLGALGFAAREWSHAARGRDAPRAALAAAVLAFGLALAFLDISSDHHDALDGVLFWLVLALLARPTVPARR